MPVGPKYKPVRAGYYTYIRQEALDPSEDVIYWLWLLPIFRLHLFA